MSEPPFLDDGTTQLLAGEDDAGMGGLTPAPVGTFCGVTISRARRVKVQTAADVIMVVWCCGTVVRHNAVLTVW